MLSIIGVQRKMEKIKNQTHSKETFLYAFSRTLERASYYGLRSLVVLYMVGGILKMENAEALSIYGWFTASIVFSKIIGAIIGDLVIGNKKAIIIGGIIQSIGAFSLCIPSITGLYIGLFLVVLGGGLYTPNIVSNFGKLYLNKIKLLDAAFTLFYFVINIGAFFGTLAIAYIGKESGWNMGFIIAGIIMLLSIIPILFSSDPMIKPSIETKATTKLKLINISIAFISVGLFWGVYELGSLRIFEQELELSEISAFDIPNILLQSISSIISLLISLLVIFIWNYYYSTQFFKLMVGCIFGAFSFGVLFLIPEIPTEQHLALYLVSLLLLAISEVHIAPIINSILTQYGNPKYLAILISLSIIPTRLFSFIISFFNESIYENPAIALLVGAITFTILSIGLIIYNKLNKDSNNIRGDKDSL